MGATATVIGGIGMAVLLLGAHAASPGRTRDDRCLEDRELGTGGVAVGDRRATARRQLGRAAVVRRDTVVGADYSFGVTRISTRRLEVLVSDATGRVAEIIPRDTALALPRGIHLGMPRPEVERRLAPAAMGMQRGDTFTVVGCGPRGSGMDVAFDSSAVLRWASLTGFYPNGE